MVTDPQIVAMLDAIPPSAVHLRPAIESAVLAALAASDPDDGHAAAVDLFGCSGRLLALSEGHMSVTSRDRLSYAAAFLSGMAYATRNEALKHAYERGER